MNPLKVRPWAAVALIFVLILSACASAQTQTPASGSNPVPVTGATPTTGVSAAASPAAGSTDAAPNSGPSTSGVKYDLVASKSEASYSVREQLAQRSLPSDAVGKTNAIAGSVVLKPDGSIDSTASKFTVDLSTLKTDQAMRDGFVGRRILQTSQYPQAVFVPTKAEGLPATIPQSGNVSFKLTGDLTIKNVTKPVTWDVTGTIKDGVASGTATTSFTFEDFSLDQPHISVVLSLVDKINLKVDITLQRAGN